MVTNTNLFNTPYNPYGQDYSYEALAAVMAAPYLFRGAKNLWGMANPQSNIDDQMVARQQSPSIWNQASLEYLQDPTLNIAQRVQDISNQRWDTSQAGNLWYNFLNNRGSNKLLGSQGLGLSNAEIRNLRKSARQDANQDILRNIFQANNPNNTDTGGTLLNRKEWRERVAAGNTPKYTDAQGNQRGYTNYADYLKKNLWGIGLAQNYTPTQTSGGQQNTNETQQNIQPHIERITDLTEDKKRELLQISGYTPRRENESLATSWANAVNQGLISQNNTTFTVNPVSNNDIANEQQPTNQENNTPTNDLQSVINNMTDEQRQFFTNAVMKNGGQPEQNMWNLATTREESIQRAQELKMQLDAQREIARINAAPAWVNAQTNKASELYAQNITSQQVNQSDFSDLIDSIRNQRVKERAGRLTESLKNLSPDDARILDSAIRNPRNLSNTDLQSTLETIFQGANELSDKNNKASYLAYIKSMLNARMNRQMLEPTITE